MTHDGESRCYSPGSHLFRFKRESRSDMYVSSNDPAGSSTESLLLLVVHALPLQRQVIASTATVFGLSVVGRVCSAQGIFVVDADDHGLRLAKVGGVKRRLAQHRKESVDRRRVVPALNEDGSVAYADCCRSEASTQAARQTDGQTPTSRLAHTERGRQTHTAKQQQQPQQPQQPQQQHQHQNQ